MSRGINKEAIFKEQRERTRMLNLIRENTMEYDVEIYSYCIMPNHFHLLIKADLKELASFMAKVLAKFAKYYNQKHNRVGHVFQGRYRSQCVEDIGYFWNCLRYIHQNPMHMEEVKSLTDYKYSSMRELYYCKKDILSDIIFELVDERFENKEVFLEFHKSDNWNTFEDVLEEELESRLKIARELLSIYATKYETEAIEILDYVNMRQKYKKELRKILGVSIEKTAKLVEQVKREIKGTG